MLLSFSCSNLHYLSLRNCEHLTDLGVEFIVNIFSLVSVDLSGTDISNEVNKKKCSNNSMTSIAFCNIIIFHFVNNGENNNYFYFLEYWIIKGKFGNTVPGIAIGEVICKSMVLFLCFRKWQNTIF